MLFIYVQTTKRPRQVLQVTKKPLKPIMCCWKVEESSRMLFQNIPPFHCLFHYNKSINLPLQSIAQNLVSLQIHLTPGVTRSLEINA